MVYFRVSIIQYFMVPIYPFIEKNLYLRIQSKTFSDFKFKTILCLTALFIMWYGLISWLWHLRWFVLHFSLNIFNIMYRGTFEWVNAKEQEVEEQRLWELLGSLTICVNCHLHPVLTALFLLYYKIYGTFRIKVPL